MIFNLPPSAKVNKFIPKTQFFGRLSLSNKLKLELTNKVQKITWLYKIAEDTVGINKTIDIEEIQIFEIELKEKTFPKSVLKVIDKAIPYAILFVIKYNNDVAYAMSLKKSGNPDSYYSSDWNEKIEFDFVGIDLEKVYQKIIKKFIKDVDLENQGFDDIINKDDQIKTLSREINQLESKLRAEKQFNRKVELNKIYLDKKKELEALRK